IEYHGAPFSGWQRQEDGVSSVQQAVEDAIFAFCQQRLTLHVAGRTDAGVHARGQVAHFDLDYGNRSLPGADLAKALNAHLRPLPVSVIDACEVAPDFHARFSAKNKLYTYRIINRAVPLAIDNGLAWHIRRTLDVQMMQKAAGYLLGSHDFTTFRDSQCQAKSPVKTLDKFEIETKQYDNYGGREILMHAQARSFLHHQVRNMAGTLSLVGEGKWKPEDIGSALEARDRTKGGPTAPAEGLYLIRVDY
ncbi:MAG: tRNA pseudouridine(38-40) synthase TruA, partial [Proteobacteria bacterium]|nr:tRNA pseudouridine(38-40) synthase TruA [Pseudomonadota bacterium]